MIHPRINGEWLGGFASFGDVTWSHGERGCKEASFSLSLERGRRHPALSGRPLVDLMHGPLVIWSGLLAEPDWTEMRFTAQGLAYESEHLPAIDADGAPTPTASVAVDEAVDQFGWQVTRDASVPTSPLATDAGDMTVGALLDDAADAQGQWWHVRADRVLRFTSAPTSPMWHIVPGVVDLGNASDDYFSTVRVTFYDSALGGAVNYVIRSDAKAALRFGTRVRSEDLTERGPIAVSDAEAFGDGLLEKGRARMGWTGSIEVASGELLTDGGNPASLRRVESHQMVRIHGLFDYMADLDGRTYLDAVIGETSLSEDGAAITLSPLGSVPQTLAEVTEANRKEALGLAS